jgi:hypothetical protein
MMARRSPGPRTRLASEHEFRRSRRLAIDRFGRVDPVIAAALEKTSPAISQPDVGGDTDTVAADAVGVTDGELIAVSC